MRTPEVRIYFSWLLYDSVSVQMHAFYESKDVLLSKETAREYAANYRAEWAKYDTKILPALTKALGLEFYQAVIDAPCVPWIRAASDPLIMNYIYYPNQFVDALTHELCHVLLTDNNVYSTKSTAVEVNLRERWAKLFGTQHDFVALVHIPVHALCKYIYLDVLRAPERLERDMADVGGKAPYKAAWDYVNAHDYKAIVGQLKTDYQRLKQELQSE